MFRFCLVRECPVRSIRKKLNLNNLDKAVALGWSGVLILFCVGLYFVHLFKSVPGLLFRNS